MVRKSDNPNAYPSDGWEGMTLRDYFAGQALAGMLAHSGGGGSYSYFAVHAYEHADAMLQARKDT